MNIFICHVPFHFYLYKSIYKQLENSYFIIPPLEDKVLSSEYGGGMSKTGLYEYLEDFLNRKKVKTIDYGERTVESVAKFLNNNVNNVIVPHWFEGIALLNNTRVIRLMYGLVDKGSVAYSIKDNMLMDVILTYGPNQASKFPEQMFLARPVGNPIFDDWFNNDIPEYESRDIERRLDDKPTILYLPTFTRFSSIEIFLDSIISLSKNYNVIVKLHHGTFNGEANRLCKLLSYPELIVLGDYIDPQILYKLADIVLVENSGAVYDALLLKKPVIMLGASLGNDGYDVYDEKDKTHNFEKSDIIPSTNSAKELEKLIEDNIGKSICLDNSQRYSLFYKIDGCAGKRAAEIILNREKYPAISTLDKYEKAIENAPDEKTKALIINKRNYFVKKVHHLPVKKPSLLKKVLNRLSSC